MDQPPPTATVPPAPRHAPSAGSAQEFTEELEILIRARYPLLYVVTAEEGRLQQVLFEIAVRRQKRLFEWSACTGIVAAGTSIQLPQHRTAPTRDPLIALDQVIDQVEPAIYLFKDFHPHLTRHQPAILRKLKDISLHLKNSFKTVVLVSPVLEIPAELEKEITVLTFPLPDHDDLANLLDRIIQEIKPHPQVQIDLDEDDREHLLQASLGLTLGEAENVFAKILVQEQCLDRKAVHAVLAEKQQIIRKNGLLEYHPSRETFADLGGMSVLKDWLRKRAVAFTREAREFGLPPPKGVLLLGVQGCGKSLCAKSIANHWQLPLLRFDVGRMFGSLVGSSEENVRRAIAVAESVAPAILWVDEIDKAFAGSQTSGFTDNGTTARVFGTFLTWLAEKTAPVFVVATTNDISQLPAELLRKGRFDEIFFVDLPLVAERREIFAIHLAKRNRNPAQFNLDLLAATSDTCSGAEIEQAVISALYDAFHAGTDITTDLLLASLRETVPLARTMDDAINRLRQWADGRARNATVTAPHNSLNK